MSEPSDGGGSRSVPGSAHRYPTDERRPRLKQGDILMFMKKLSETEAGETTTSYQDGGTALMGPSYNALGNLCLGAGNLPNLENMDHVTEKVDVLSINSGTRDLATTKTGTIPNLYDGNDLEDYVDSEEFVSADDMDDSDFMKDDDIRPFTKSLLNGVRTDFEHFFAEFKTVDECRDFFKLYKKFFSCDCGGQMNADGKAKNTYRLACKRCNVTTSFTRAIENMRTEINIRFETGMQSDDNMTVTPDKNEEVRTGNKRKLAEDQTDTSRHQRSDDDFDQMSNDETNMTEQVPRVVVAGPRIDADLFTLLKDIKLELAAQRKINEENAARITNLEKDNLRIQELEEENCRLRAQLAMVPKPGEAQPSPPAGAWKTVGQADGKPVISYSSIAAFNCPKPAPKANTSGDGQKGKPIMRKLTEEELDRLYKGLPIKPARKVTALYFTGLAAMKIHMIKDIFKYQHDMSLKNILHIDFIGKSLTEVHLYEDYVDTFKELLTKNSQRCTFVDVDPLDGGLLRYAVVENKALEAAKRYHDRLTRRLTQTPVTGHKKFLKLEIEKAKAILDHEEGLKDTNTASSGNSMDIDTNSAATQTAAGSSTGGVTSFQN